MKKKQRELGQGQGEHMMVTHMAHFSYHYAFSKRSTHTNTLLNLFTNLFFVYIYIFFFKPIPQNYIVIINIQNAALGGRPPALDHVCPLSART